MGLTGQDAALADQLPDFNSSFEEKDAGAAVSADAGAAVSAKPREYQAWDKLPDFNSSFEEKDTAAANEKNSENQDRDKSPDLNSSYEEKIAAVVKDKNTEYEECLDDWGQVNYQVKLPNFNNSFEEKEKEETSDGQHGDGKEGEEKEGAAVNDETSDDEGFDDKDKNADSKIFSSAKKSSLKEKLSKANEKDGDGFYDDTSEDEDCEMTDKQKVCNDLADLCKLPAPKRKNVEVNDDTMGNQEEGLQQFGKGIEEKGKDDKGKDGKGKDAEVVNDATSDDQDGDGKAKPTGNEAVQNAIDEVRKTLWSDDEDEKHETLLCSQCYKDFWYKTEYLQHMKRDHGILDPVKHEQEQKALKLQQEAEEKRKKALAIRNEELRKERMIKLEKQRQKEAEFQRLQRIHAKKVMEQMEMKQQEDFTKWGVWSNGDSSLYQEPSKKYPRIKKRMF